MRIVIIVALMLLHSACGKLSGGETTFNTELQRLGSGTALALQSNQVTTANSEYSWTSNLKIESLTMPIVSIALGDSTGSKNTTIYECSGDCTVDLLGPELTNLLEDKATKLTDSGEFTSVYVTAINSSNSAES